MGLLREHSHWLAYPPSTGAATGATVPPNHPTSQHFCNCRHTRHHPLSYVRTRTERSAGWTLDCGCSCKPCTWAVSSDSYHELAVAPISKYKHHDKSFCLVRIILSYLHATYHQDIYTHPPSAGCALVVGVFFTSSSSVMIEDVRCLFINPAAACGSFWYHFRLILLLSQALELELLVNSLSSEVPLNSLFKSGFKVGMTPARR